MAVRPELALAGVSPNIIQALTQGQALGETIRDSGVRGQILRQQEQLGQQAVETGAANLAQNRAKMSYNFLLGLKDVPLANRAAIVAQQMPMLTQLGLTESQIMSQDLSNAGLDQSIASLRPMFSAQDQTQVTEFERLISGFTPEEQEEARRIKAGLAPRAKHEQLTKIADNVFAVYDPATGSFRDPVDQEGKAITRQQQVDLGIADRIQEVTSVGEAETAVETGRRVALGDIELEQAAAQQQQQIDITRRNNFVDEKAAAAQAAASALPNLEQAYLLAQTADQGLTAGAKLYLSRLPGLSGIDVGDSAALDSALKGLALKELAAFKGPTTDFEFRVVQDIAGDILGSAPANKARVASLKRANWFTQREAEQAQSFINQGGDPNDFRFNFQEELDINGKTYTLQDLQETAVYYNMGIEEAIEAIRNIKQ